jgi:hypothetical protein
MKKIIKKIITLLGYRISKDRASYFSLIKKLICKSNPIILDMGANKGQSIL